MKSKKIISYIFIVAIAIVGFIFVLKVETEPLPTMKGMMILPDITKWVEFGSSEKYDPILNEINKPRQDTVVSVWIKYSSENLGINFDYPSQYGTIYEPIGTSGMNSQLKSYGMQIGESSIISIQAVEKGWSDSEPSFMSSLANSDYLGCDAYIYTTKNSISGYKLSSGYTEGDNCAANLRGSVIDGYYIYVFDLKRIPDAKISFITSSHDKEFTEKLLDTLEIYN